MLVSTRSSNVARSVGIPARWTTAAQPSTAASMAPRSRMSACRTSSCRSSRACRGRRSRSRRGRCPARPSRSTLPIRPAAPVISTRLPVMPLLPLRVYSVHEARDDDRKRRRRCQCAPYTACTFARTPLGLDLGGGPLYQQLRQRLYSRIRRGEVGPGDMLPSENQLCDEYGGSATTARRPLLELVEGGVVGSRMGGGAEACP